MLRRQIDNDHLPVTNPCSSPEGQSLALQTEGGVPAADRVSGEIMKAFVFDN